MASNYYGNYWGTYFGNYWGAFVITPGLIARGQTKLTIVSGLVLDVSATAMGLSVSPQDMSLTIKGDDNE